MLSRLLLRNACVQALKELETDGSYPTFAGANVFDSRIYPAEMDVNLLEVPFVSIYTDTQKYADNKDREMAALVTNVVQQVDLCLNLAIAANVTTTDDKGEEFTGPAIVETDAELEALLDIMEAQVHWTLSNPSKHWSQIFGALCQDIPTFESSRESDGSKNNRLALRELKMSCIICADPRPMIMPANVKVPTTRVQDGVPVTGTYLDEMFRELAMNVQQRTGNLSTAMAIMRSTFGEGSGILMPALRRIGATFTMKDAAIPKTGVIEVARTEIKVGSDDQKDDLPC